MGNAALGSFAPPAAGGPFRSFFSATILCYMEHSSGHHGFLSRISTPAWRWGALFACWGVTYLVWIDFVLLTNVEELQEQFLLRPLGMEAVACLLVLATHLAGLRFAPKRWLRILLWLHSLC